MSRIVPYAIPPPRSFDEWLEAFGLSCERGRPDTVGQLSYEDFCETHRRAGRIAYGRVESRSVQTNFILRSLLPAMLKTKFLSVR